MNRLLDRMRVTFKDELLVRNGRRLDVVVTGDPFTPERCDTTFRLATTDYASAVLVPAVLSDLETFAPNGALEIVTLNDRAFEDLTAGRIDAAIGGATGAPRNCAARSSSTMTTSAWSRTPRKVQVQCRSQQEYNARQLSGAMHTVAF
jgi:hypothetical protein